jgi:hypothetical protein
VLEHSRRFDDAPELELSPLTAHVGRAERFHEAGRLTLKRPKLLVETGGRADPLPFDVLDLGVETVQRFGDRLDECGNRLLASGEVARRTRLRLAEPGCGKLQKLFVAGAKRLARQRGELFTGARGGAALGAQDQQDDSCANYQTDGKIQELHSHEY